MRSSDRDRRPRVLYLITNDISARFLRGQLAHLIDHGYDVAVGTSRSDPPNAFDDGVEVVSLPFRREPAVGRDVRALIATIRTIRSWRPDVVNASTPKAGLLGMIAARLCRVPQRVYVVRGLRFETMDGVARTVYRRLERLASACATDVVFNSPSLVATAEREGAVRPGRGIVLGAGSGNGIDTERYRELPDRADARRELGIADDAAVVGFVGRLTRDKGIADLVAAHERLPAGTVLVLVGDEEPGDPIDDATRRRLADDPTIVRVPWLDDTRIAYAAMDVLAFPSSREGLPNVPLEAQLCGVPVVAYAATGTVDAIEDGVGGVLVPVGDTTRLADELDRTLGDPERYTGGRAWVTARFDQDVIWSALAAVYAAGS